MRADIQTFLDQFEVSDREVMSRLSNAFVFVDREEIKTKLREHFSLHNGLASAAFIGLGHVTESGNEILNDLRRALSNLAVPQFIMSDQLHSANLTPYDEFIFLDDFIGTGQQAITYFEVYPEIFERE